MELPLYLFLYFTIKPFKCLVWRVHFHWISPIQFISLYFFLNSIIDAFFGFSSQKGWVTPIICTFQTEGQLYSVNNSCFENTLNGWSQQVDHLTRTNFFKSLNYCKDLAKASLPQPLFGFSALISISLWLFPSVSNIWGAVWVPGIMKTRSPEFLISLMEWLISNLKETWEMSPALSEESFCSDPQ